MADIGTAVADRVGVELTREELGRRLAAVGFVADPQLLMAIVLVQRLECAGLCHRSGACRTMARGLGSAVLRVGGWLISGRPWRTGWVWS